MRQLWICDRIDGYSEIITTDKSPIEAIDEWFLGDDYDTCGADDTVVVTIAAGAIVDGEPTNEELASKTFTIDPPEPDCVELQEHDWCAPHSVVGGVKENPGTYGGHGGKITSTTVCRHCGRYRETSTIPGEHSSLRYHEANERSLAWAETRGET